jgi:hypothetical protein
MFGQHHTEMAFVIHCDYGCDHREVCGERARILLRVCPYWPATGSFRDMHAPPKIFRESFKEAVDRSGVACRHSEAWSSFLLGRLKLARIKRTTVHSGALEWYATFQSIRHLTLKSLRVPEQHRHRSN